VTVSLASEDTRAGSITLDVRAERPQNVSEGDSAEVLLAITESGLRSSVSRGENAGRRLSHTAVVRKLMALGSVDSQGGAQFVAKPVVQIPGAGSVRVSRLLSSCRSARAGECLVWQRHRSGSSIDFSLCALM